MYQARRTIHWLFMAVLLVPLTLHAAVLEGFYQVAVPATEGQDRSQALREAAQLMVTRQAGSDALGNDAVQAAMQDPRPLMSRIAGTEAGGVQVEFEPAALRDLLTEAGLSVLGPNRPAVMLWAVENKVLGPELLSQGGEWSEALSEAARARAVALSLPLADLEDRTLVDVKAIEQADEQTLKQASQRYDASAVLALTISETTDESVLEWAWWLNEQSESGRITAESRAAAADQLMLEIADLVVEQYGVTPSTSVESSQWQIVVDGVDSVGEFAGLQRTLQQLGSKRAPRVLSVKGGEVRLALDFPGSEEQLERLLALDQRMRRMPAPEPELALFSQSGPDSDTGAVDEPTGPGIDGAAANDADTLPEPAMEPSEQMVEELAAPEPTANIMYFRLR